MGTFVDVADDKPAEFLLDSLTSARGIWVFDESTDGGVLSGLPTAGSWSIDVVPQVWSGVQIWQYVRGDHVSINLDLAPLANLTAFGTPSGCRTDCTVPRCGDGRLDGGEVCDDGNVSSGDGCAADCSGS